MSLISDKVEALDDRFESIVDWSRNVGMAGGAGTGAALCAPGLWAAAGCAVIGVGVGHVVGDITFEVGLVDRQQCCAGALSTNDCGCW